MKILSCIICVFAITLRITTGFNVDTANPLIYSELPKSLFGFSVALSKVQGRYALFAGAPTANSSFDSAYQPGAIYACLIGGNFCQEVNLNYQQGAIMAERYYNYKPLRNNSWLGIALDVTPDDSQLVACGHLWKDQQYTDDYVVNGICYVANTSLNLKSIRRLLPLVWSGKQVVDRQYIYALGLSGMSAHYAADNSTLLIGAPGVFQMSGTVIGVPNYDRLLQTVSQIEKRPDYFIPFPENRSEDSYFGYSITSGKFLSDNKTLYVASAPREGIYGMVYFYTFNEDNPNVEVTISLKLEGKQMGEYFGGSVCAVDVNNDGYSDLIVGAPLYSKYEEEGRVYVFLSERRHINAMATFLTGSSIMKARFGTAVAAVGDINLDGYQDIAVGAPYEGSGAVYIYHGSAGGIINKEAQKILAVDISPNLKGFGVSISRGKDIDDNLYPDIAVGAAVSASAVVLRSKPVVKISGSLDFDTNHINTEVKNCSENGKPVTCFVLNACISYDGAHAPNVLEMEILINIDTLKKDLQGWRVYYFDNGRNNNTISFYRQLMKGIDGCFAFSINVKSDIVDFLTPVSFTLSSKIKEPAVRSEFCKTCPAVDINSASLITKQLSFFTGCGADDKCISDLHLDAFIAKYRSEDVLVLGSENNLNLIIDVRNDNDPAFQATLKVLYPPHIDYSRVPSECSPYSENSSIGLLCNLGNPLEPGRMVSLNVSVDLQKLPPTTKILTFNLSVSSASEEEDANLNDNVVSLSLPVKPLAVISTKGWHGVEPVVVYNRSDPGTIAITHMYQISKLEPSPVRFVDIEFQFPISTSEKLSFLQRSSVDAFYNNQKIPSGNCHSQVIEPSSFGRIEQIDTEYGKGSALNCVGMVCHSMKCRVGPFLKRESVSINFTASVELPTLLKVTNIADILVFQTKASASILDETYIGQPESIIFSSSEVSTNFLPQDLVPQASPVAVWIIILAIIGGLLLLAIIIVIFYKLGFFRRKDHEKLLHEASKENDDGSSINDGEDDALHTGRGSPQ